MKANESKKGCARETFCVAWQFIDWQKVRGKVRSLQRRIVKAIKEGRHNRARALQWLLTHSWSAKLLAVKRVTENSGKRTAGVDGVIWRTPEQKLEAARSLTRKRYRAQPLRRIYIPKRNGKMRPLGIPAKYDRAQQALYLLALDPISETTADNCSYGFRPKRGCADAIIKCFTLLARRNGAEWILEGDIKGCFDHINHEWISENIPMDKRVLEQWLKAGFIDNKRLFPTKEGTPQGGIISPTIANMVLDGMDKAIMDAVGVTVSKTNGWKLSNKHQVHLVRYADDFIVTSNSKEVLETRILPTIKQFLGERGLLLSEEKTMITSIYKGFDFLGQNIRKYGRGKLLITPSKDSISAITATIKAVVKKLRTSTPDTLISHLNPIIRGWCNYHRHACVSRAFNSLDKHLWNKTWRWAKRRHPKKNASWIRKKYFASVGSDNWIFFGKGKNGKVHKLIKARNICIQRHWLIKGAANPYDPDWDFYFLSRKYRKVDQLPLISVYSLWPARWPGAFPRAFTKA
jgi:RNA-directed DNA polymerase